MNRKEGETMTKRKKTEREWKIEVQRKRHKEEREMQNVIFTNRKCV